MPPCLAASMPANPPSSGVTYLSVNYLGGALGARGDRGCGDVPVPVSYLRSYLRGCAGRWTAFEKEVLMLIRISYRDTSPDRTQVMNAVGLMEPFAK